jgi:hypothetical protein
MLEKGFDAYTYVDKTYFNFRPNNRERIYISLLENLKKIAEREGYSLIDDTIEYSHGEDLNRNCPDSYKVTIKGRFSLN